MRIRFKLFAMLSQYLPPGAGRHEVELEVPEATTPQALIDTHHIPHEMAHLVLLNGHYLEPAQRRQPVLKDGDTLAIWPPVAGG